MKVYTILTDDVGGVPSVAICITVSGSFTVQHVLTASELIALRKELKERAYQIGIVDRKETD